MRNATFSSAALIWYLTALSAHAGVVYHDIFPPNYSVTGIRQDTGPSNPVVITGSYSLAGQQPQALLYRGSLYPTDPAGFYYPNPFSGQMVTVTTSIFYGPNTSLFDPSLGPGNIRAVGSYKYSEDGEGGKFDHGMIYQGSLQGSVGGSGSWTQINYPNAKVADTIPHSTMGNLVVGNYDLQDASGNQDPLTGSAFIYNIDSQTFTSLDLGPLTTAYGIWQNGDSSSTQYTIVGGVDAGLGINKGFMLDYDSLTGDITNMKQFSGFNHPGFITHFEGITEFEGGYALAATTDTGAAWVSIQRNSDGSFGTANWVAISDPNSIGIITGNTVIDNNLLGIYTPGDRTIQSYVATVPEPSTLYLLGIGLAGLALLHGRGRRIRCKAA